jgi:chromosome segregation ATPase
MTLSMIAALVMLAAAVVVKILTVELLATHHRRCAHLQDQLDAARSDLRAEVTKRAAVERHWRSAEHRRHRLRVRIDQRHGEIDVLEFDQSARAAHFDLLTSHLVER